MIYPVPLPIHLSIHFVLALLVGYLAYRRTKLFWLSMIAGVLGGFLIDVDHILEYIIVFHRFSFFGFTKGWQFLWSGRSYLIFHAWEYLPILLGAAYLLRRRRKVAIFIAVLAIAGFVHLVSDVFINQYPVKFYSITYRLSRDFQASELLPERNLLKNQAEYQEWYPEMAREAGK